MEIHPVTKKFIKDIMERAPRKVEFLGYTIKINTKVFPVDSPFSFSSKMTAKRINPKKGDVVLDVGTGTGVQAIIAAKRGAKQVLAIDIDENSLNCAKENVELHHLEDVIEIRKSDLFENIKDDEKFDLIISQLPFADSDCETKVKHFLFDPDFKLHEKLLKDAKEHLKENGRILIPSGEIANEEKLLKLIEKYNYKIVSVEEEKAQDLIWKVYFLSN